MAHFVELDENNIVVSAEVVADHVATTESAGVTFLNKLHDNTSNWKRTYKDGTRKNYAGLGFVYDVDRDAFRPKQPYPSWNLNEDTCRWEAPIQMPDDDNDYRWDEDTTSWVEVSR